MRVKSSKVEHLFFVVNGLPAIIHSIIIEHILLEYSVVSHVCIPHSHGDITNGHQFARKPVYNSIFQNSSAPQSTGILYTSSVRT